jgi:hypothetical protein
MSSSRHQYPNPCKGCRTPLNFLHCSSDAFLSQLPHTTTKAIRLRCSAVSVEAVHISTLPDRNLPVRCSTFLCAVDEQADSSGGHILDWRDEYSSYRTAVTFSNPFNWNQLVWIIGYAVCILGCEITAFTPGMTLL